MLVQALRCLFATPLSLGRLCNGMFYVKLSQAQRPFISFHVFSGGRCTFCFFLCAGGSPSVLVQALRCFSQHHCRLGRLGNCMFSVKSLQAQRPFISFHVFSGGRCTFFCVQVGCRPCWSRLCVVFRNAIAVWQVGQLHVFRQKFAGTACFFRLRYFQTKKCVAIGFC